MAGLLVVAASVGADVAAVARALGGGEPAYGDAAASPLTSAAHVGERLDPAALLARLRALPDGSVATAAGGVLGPLTPRYSVRDLARELAWPLVLAVPATGDLVNLARLSLEAARGGGLAVAAVVLTGWPDPPSRVQLDERRLLGELAEVPVHALDGSEAAWPVAEWLAAGPPAAEAVAFSLEPYMAWEPRDVPDPRVAPRPALMTALLEIVTAEGPMRASRAYGLYNRASGGRKLTSIARAPLSSALHWLAREGKIVLTAADEIPWQDDDLVRAPDAPAVRVRSLGPRTLEEVPLDEIAELMRRLRAAGAPDDPEGLKRATLTAYGLVRLTTRADEYLGLALDLAA
jgi:hypothetical protein